jgi:small-conductance mechanosensitive channel
VVFEWRSWPGFLIAVLLAVVAAFLITLVVASLVRAFARRKDWAKSLVSHARLPFRVAILTVGLWLTVAFSFPDQSWLGILDQALRIALIASCAWLGGQLLLFAEDLAVARHRIDIPDNRVARRIRTQMLIVRRLTTVIIVIVALGAILLTFPEVRTVGASLLASAGIASVVAGLAAQSLLANMFAGIQLAFSDALRVDDVVVVEGEWGRVGEITLSYVVVDIWDERRLVLPCTYFTTQPFESWTRQASQLLGAVEFDLDWRVSPAGMRERLAEILRNTTLWDGRAQVLQVTDAVGGFVRVRILVTAMDAPTLFDLRCYVREEMVSWLQQTAPGALPRQRVQVVPDNYDADEREEAPSTAQPAESSTGADRGALFSGSPEAEKRASQFTGSISVIPPEERIDE